MSTEENKAVVRRWIEEAWNRGSVAVIDELAAPDFVDHHLLPGFPPNVTGNKAWAHAARAGFPDIHITIEDLIAEGDKVVSRIRFTGTHTGEFLGIPPSGKQATVEGIGISRILDGKAIEYWENFDALGLMQQIGAIPLPEGASS